MTKKIKIIIADDHILVRQSIAVALQTNKKFEVVGQADNGRVLIDLVKQLSPDVIVLDLEMPVMNGWEAMEYLREHHPDCKIVVVSMHFDALFIKDLVEKGARGFLPKNSDFETLINAIHEVNDLGYFFSKKISPNIVKELLMSNAIEPVFLDTNLTDKEIDTLRLICTDKNTKEIAERLNVSDRTVERYKSSLYEKTKAKTSAGLVLYALKNNIVVISV
jgi:DNA-binding NarL/FixJ family response regulator